MLALETLNAERFATFGTVIDNVPEGGEPFEVLLREPQAQGWRLARSRVTRSAVEVMGLHDMTREAFAPLSGLAVMIVAEASTPERCRAFVLDRPVCLHRSVWHATTALTDTATFLIAENDQVGQQTFSLPAPLMLALASLEDYS